MQVIMKSAMQVEASAAPPLPAATKVETSPFETVQQLASSNAVVVFSYSDCCMSTVAKRLLFSLGVGPTVIELDQHDAGPPIKDVLCQLSGVHQQAVPAVFVGGKFLGGVQTLMASHINGTLIPLLKEAGALWL